MVSDEQRRVIAIEGTPLPLIDRESGRAYLLLSVEFSAASSDGVRAQVPGITAIGEGEAPDGAVFALCEAWKAHIRTVSQDR